MDAIGSVLSRFSCFVASFVVVFFVFISTLVVVNAKNRVQCSNWSQLHHLDVFEGIKLHILYLGARTIIVNGRRTVSQNL